MHVFFPPFFAPFVTRETNPVPTALFNARRSSSLLSSFCPLDTNEPTEILRILVVVIYKRDERERKDSTRKESSFSLTFDFDIVQKKKKEKEIRLHESSLKKKKKEQQLKDASTFSKSINRDDATWEGKKWFSSEKPSPADKRMQMEEKGERRWDGSWESWPAKRSWKRG